MKKASASICLGLGDNIIARIIFDTVKHQYSEIRISHDQNVINHYKKGDVKYLQFLQDMGNLLFTEPPYFFDHNAYSPIHTMNTIQNFSPIAKPNLQHLLCKGIPLETNEEYIVITTKIRMIPKNKFLPLSIKLWRILNILSDKYKIIIMGERELKESPQYRGDLPENSTYSIYDQIISNLSADRIVDLTIPALGIVAPNLVKIQQDGLIMKHAKAVIALGDGGNLWHAVATGNKIIAYRDDNDQSADLLLNPNFMHVKMHKIWSEFIQELEGL
ncbi:MAG TPA: hypothetical protein VII94_00800 [Candidatus Saccharimonadales bacterium]